MALQIRLSLPEFSSGINFTDPIIIERADNITLSKTVNSETESISFTVPPNDPKVASGVNYLRWWEAWDTETNTRKNYGPIDGITEIIFPPAATIYQTRHLLGANVTPCGNHQIIIIDRPVSAQFDPVLVRLDQLDLTEDHVYCGWQEVAFGLDHVSGGIDTERNEQETGLVIMVLVFVYYHDAPFL